MIKSKKQMLIIISSFILVLLLCTTTYAFFNYTRTGISNTIRVGRIYFNTTQNNTINLTNVFPTDSSSLDNTNSATVTVNITGDTEYSEGIEYKVSIVDVENTVNGKELPISFSVEANDLGTESNDYYNDRGSTANVYNLVESGLAENDKTVLIGYIKSDNVGIDGSIDITAYLDKNEIGISDTVSRIENNNLVYGETDAEWIAGRTILTTTEWNSLQTTGVNFKVKVEANEGIWISEPQYTVLKNLNDIQDWKNIRASVTSVEYHSDGETIENPISTIDATDLSSEGPVTVYILDDGLGNSTYKAVIVADGEIYAPENSLGLFQRMTALTDFNSENFKVDNVVNMSAIFNRCTNLTNISSLSSWNTSNATNMYGMFSMCASLSNINSLSSWDVSSVESTQQMFYQCTSLTNVDALLNWNTISLTNMAGMFYDCTALTNVNGLVNWNTSNVEFINSLFRHCTSLNNITGLTNWNTSNVVDMTYFFESCSSLRNTDSLANWDMSKVTSDRAMYESSTGLRTITLPNNCTRMDDFMFNHNSGYTGSSFTIPKTVTSIGNTHMFYDFGKDDIFTKFIVEEGNTAVKTIDDILYTYDGTRLVSVPRGKTFTNRTFEIPEGVTFLNELSFSRNKNIDTLVLPNSYVIERYITANTANTTNNNYGFLNSGSSLNVAIYSYTSIKWYEIKNDNPNYSSYNGCIYSKDGTELIAVPLYYDGVLNIKTGTTIIGQDAFWVNGTPNFDNLTQINIPASVTTIEAGQLTTLNTLMRRSTHPITVTIDSGNTAYEISNNQIIAK